MVDAATLATSVPYLISTGAIVVAIGAWLARLPHVAVLLLPLSLVAGQLVRFPVLGQGGGLLLSDVAVALVLIGAAFRFLHANLRQQGKSNKQKVELRSRLITFCIVLIAPFLAWSFFTLAVNAPGYTTDQITIAGLYWVRLAAYLLLLPALVYLMTFRLKRSLNIAMLWSIGALVALGLVQWVVFSDLAGIGSGWDPHSGRLVSTWLDPNFVGLFLALALLWWGAMFAKQRPFIAAGGAGVLLVALVLTQSRSSVLALGVAALIGLVLWVLHGRHQASSAQLVRLLFVTLTIVVLVGVMSIPLLSRLGEFVYPVFDPTFQLRLEAFEGVWGLATLNWQVGVGYNTYQFAAAAEGLIADFAIHSRAGSDSSFLTLWVTTGVIGVAFFSLPFLVLGVVCVRRWLLHQHVSSLALVLCLVAVFVHAHMINSALYGHILLFVALIASLVLTDMGEVWDL